MDIATLGQRMPYELLKVGRKWVVGNQYEKGEWWNHLEVGWNATCSALVAGFVEDAACAVENRLRLRQYRQLHGCLVVIVVW